MFLFYSSFFFICTGVLQGAVIRDTFKDEGGGSTHVTNKTHSKEKYYEYALDKSYHDLEYLKISILSKTKFSDTLPNPRVIWTNKTVPYIIYTKSSIKEKITILEVIKLLNSETCINFVERSDEEVFITITPKTRLKNTLCHRRGNNIRKAKVRKGILSDLKFSLDFEKRIGKHNVKEIAESLFQTINDSIDQKFKSLNSFYNCREVDSFGFKFLNGIINLKVKNQNDSKKTLVHYRKKRSNGKANYGAIITTEPNIPVKTAVTFDYEAIDDATYDYNEDLLAENPLSTVITSNGIIPITVSDIIQDLKILETITGDGTSPSDFETKIDDINQTSTGFTEAASIGITNIPPTTNNVYGQPPFPDKPSKTAYDPYGRMESPEKPVLSDGAKDIYLNDTQVIIVEESAVHEHKLGRDDKHLHHKLGSYVGFEGSKGLDGFHKMNIVDENPIQFRTVLKNPAKLWTDGMIPFVLSDKYDQRQKQLLTEGIEQFLNKTCVQFVQRTNEETYVNIAPDSRCSATIGKIEGGINNVTLSDGCFLPGTIVHELMHVLGFVHEQNRPDRDSFVMIAWDNIIESARPNFRKYRKGQVQDFGVGYDYDSVMHYGMYDFAKDLERPTIIPLQAGTMIGQRDGFSQKDLLKVKRLFQCEEAPKEVEAPKEEETPQEEVLPESEIGFRRRKQKTPAGSNFKSKFLRYLKKLFKSLYASLINFTKVSI